MSLNFGRTHLPDASGRFEIGALECSGSRASSETKEQGTIMKLIPTNCSDLFQIGHVLNGFYSVLIEEPDAKNSSNQKTLMTKTIFCDFSRSPAVGDEDGQYFNSIIASTLESDIIEKINLRIHQFESKV